jgi:hypothetical protein
MMKKANNNNPWTREDEWEHPHSVMEWWCLISFLKSIEDKKRWSSKISFCEWCKDKKEIGSIINFDLFDQDEEKHFIYYLRNDSTKLKTVKDSFYISYDDSYMKGKYPNYELYINDKKNNIKVNITFTAEALPRWIAQDVTSGQLPLGLGYYKYGFIPKCKISGTIEINKKTYNIGGMGYYEHVWGDIWFDNPLSGYFGLKKTISIYLKLINWWLQNIKLSIPKSIMFSTENNPFGYDWTWALLDNGWAIYYGNIMFFIMEGPAAGTLILTKDGKKYEEFNNIHFWYNKTRYSKEYDFYYPSDLELIAIKGNEKLNLRFIMTNDTRQYLARFSSGAFWRGFIICESPGVVEGSYSDGIKDTKLAGICKMEPQRQISVMGHNSLKIDILKPPSGVGVSFDLDSNFLRKKMFAKIQLSPKPKIKFNLKKIANLGVDKK